MKRPVPPLSQDVVRNFEELMKEPAVQAALKQADDERDFALAEQIALSEIPSPTFKERERAEEYARRMREYGLKDVRIDEVGNVVGRRPGKGDGPLVVMGAHMDTVFPEGTDVKVRREGNVLYGPGIGDNASGLRAVLQTLRMFEKNKIETKGDIWFCGTVGEEGNGDIRGSKHLFKTHGDEIDGFLAVDNTDTGRILWGAIGAHRWRITIAGPGGHSYGSFGEIPSAIHAMCLAGTKVSRIKCVKEPKTTYNIGTIVGGTTVNTIASKCSVDVDIRSLDNDILLALEAEIKQCFVDAVDETNAEFGVTPENKGLRLEFEQIGDRPAGFRPDDCPVILAARGAQAAIGIELNNYSISSTDANAPVSMGIPATCLSAGGCQMRTHTVDEYFEITDIENGPKMIFLTALALAGTDKVAPMLPKRNK